MESDFQRRKTLIFLATYNERSNIDRLLDAILALPIDCDVLVVDDNSSDGTGTYLRERVAADARVMLISRAGRLGVGSAHRLGWLFARRLDYAQIVTLDADFSHDPLDALRLIAALEAGADIAFGSRYIPGGKLDYRGWRLFLSRTANSLARHLLRLPIAEYTNSYRAARLDRVPLGLIETIPNDGYSFFLTATLRLIRSGIRITEVPIHFHDRDGGVSKMPKFELLNGAANLVRLFFNRRPFDSTAIAMNSLESYMQSAELYTSVRSTYLSLRKSNITALLSTSEKSAAAGK